MGRSSGHLFTYNRSTLNLSLRIFLALTALLTVLGVAVAQKPFVGGKTAVVMPFENASSAPGLEWISEAFPEILEERLSSPSLFVLSREDRLRAYDQMGIPADVHPSRATVYRIAEQMGVDYVVLGRYTFDGRTLTATAQLLDMNRQRLSPEARESAPLVQLIDIQTLIAWDLLRVLRPDFPTAREVFRNSAEPVRLDVLENYVRGITASTTQDKIRFFQQAIRQDPQYAKARFDLGRAYYSERQYDDAVSTLEKIPRTHPLARQASFVLGLAAYFRGNYGRAKDAFQFIASQFPLTEVYNNLGVLAARQNDSRALGDFQKAVQADPADADYRFNLGLAYYHAGNLADAARQLREAVNLHPSDTEAQAFLDAISPQATTRLQPSATKSTIHAPLERIKPNYDESSFRQIVVQMEAAEEQALAKDPRAHARFHVTRAHELLAQGFVIEAEREFREAVALDSASAEAHAGLAQTLESKQDLSGARMEAEAALRIRTSVEPLLILAHINLSENRADAAAEYVDRALQLEPANSSALALKRTIAAKLAQKAQPLPNQ
ncbi:MAG TPA: tetratricopeptide repeat protein [Terriglobales bacterium]|nr:tetratricopeptide repeat protein [Terriglobales bacterium]